LDHGSKAVLAGALGSGACYRPRRRCHAPGSLAAVWPSGACDPDSALLGRDELRM